MADCYSIDDNTDGRSSINAGVVFERRKKVGVFAAVEDDLLNFAVKDSGHLKLGLLGALLCPVQRLVVVQPVGPRVVEENWIRPESKDSVIFWQMKLNHQLF